MLPERDDDTGGAPPEAPDAALVAGLRLRRGRTTYGAEGWVSDVLSKLYFDAAQVSDTRCFYAPAQWMMS